MIRRFCSRFHILNRMVDQIIGILRRFRRFGRKASDLFRHHGEPCSRRTGAGGFHRSVQCQNICLKRNIFNCFDDCYNLSGRLINISCRSHKLLHLLIRFFRVTSRLIHKLIRAPAVCGAVLNLRRNGRHISNQTFHGFLLLHRSLRQLLRTRRHLFRA